MTGLEITVALLAVLALVLFVAALFLFGSPWYWLGVFLGSEGDPERMKRGCLTPLKVIGALIALLLLLGAITRMFSLG